MAVLRLIRQPENWQYGAEFKQDLQQMITTLRPDFLQPVKKGKKKKTILDNLRLNDGNALSTEAESLASVGLDDTKIISIEENSRAEFYQKGKKLELVLTKGRLFFDVQQPLADNESLDIKSSTMVVGIRGTSGYVWEDPAKNIQCLSVGRFAPEAQAGHSAPDSARFHSPA